MGTFIDNQGVFHNERRRNIPLRAVYDVASQRIDHLVRTDSEWVNPPPEYLAQRIIHESYPHLGAQDVRTLVAVIGRKYQKT